MMKESSCSSCTQTNDSLTVLQSQKQRTLSSLHPGVMPLTSETNTLLKTLTLLETDRSTMVATDSKPSSTTNHEILADADVSLFVKDEKCESLQLYDGRPCCIRRGSSPSALSGTISRSIHPTHHSYHRVRLPLQPDNKGTKGGQRSESAKRLAMLDGSPQLSTTQQLSMEQRDQQQQQHMHFTFPSSSINRPIKSLHRSDSYGCLRKTTGRKHTDIGVRSMSPTYFSQHNRSQSLDRGAVGESCNNDSLFSENANVNYEAKKKRQCGMQSTSHNGNEHDTQVSNSYDVRRISQEHTERNKEQTIDTNHSSSSERVRSPGSDRCANSSDCKAHSSSRSRLLRSPAGQYLTFENQIFKKPEGSHFQSHTVCSVANQLPPSPKDSKPVSRSRKKTSGTRSTAGTRSAAGKLQRPVQEVKRSSSSSSSLTSVAFNSNNNDFHSLSQSILSQECLPFHKEQATVQNITESDALRRRIGRSFSVSQTIGPVESSKELVPNNFAKSSNVQHCDKSQRIIHSEELIQRLPSDNPSSPQKRQNLSYEHRATQPESLYHSNVEKYRNRRSTSRPVPMCCGQQSDKRTHTVAREQQIAELRREQCIAELRRLQIELERQGYPRRRTSPQWHATPNSLDINDIRQPFESLISATRQGPPANPITPDTTAKDIPDYESTGNEKDTEIPLTCGQCSQMKIQISHLTDQLEKGTRKLAVISAHRERQEQRMADARDQLYQLLEDCDDFPTWLTRTIGNAAEMLSETTTAWAPDYRLIDSSSLSRPRFQSSDSRMTNEGFDQDRCSLSKADDVIRLRPHSSQFSSSGSSKLPSLTRKATESIRLPPSPPPLDGSMSRRPLTGSSRRPTSSRTAANFASSLDLDRQSDDPDDHYSDHNLKQSPTSRPPLQSPPCSVPAATFRSPNATHVKKRRGVPEYNEQDKENNSTKDTVATTGDFVFTTSAKSVKEFANNSICNGFDGNASNCSHDDDDQMSKFRNTYPLTQNEHCKIIPSCSRAQKKRPFVPPLGLQQNNVGRGSWLSGEATQGDTYSNG